MSEIDIREYTESHVQHAKEKECTPPIFSEVDPDIKTPLCDHSLEVGTGDAFVTDDGRVRFVLHEHNGNLIVYDTEIHNYKYWPKEFVKKDISTADGPTRWVHVPASAFLP